MGTRLISFEEFWPFYVSQHQNPTNRALHFVGTTIALAVLAAAILLSPLWLVAVPVAGYGFAWVGHFFFERNQPATFNQPLLSLRGDLRMYRLMWLRRMAPELDRAHALFPARA